jgi:hypothetical protein
MRTPAVRCTVLANGASVIRQDGDSIYLAGIGSSPDGDRPFLDRLNLASGKSERLFRSDKGSFERFLSFLGPHPRTFLTWHQSATDPPNAFLHTLGAQTIALVVENRCVVVKSAAHLNAGSGLGAVDVVLYGCGDSVFLGHCLPKTSTRSRFSHSRAVEGLRIGGADALSGQCELGIGQAQCESVFVVHDKCDGRLRCGAHREAPAFLFQEALGCFSQSFDHQASIFVEDHP